MIRRVMIGLMLVMGIYSCADILDVEPEIQVSYTNFFKNEEDAAAFFYEILSRSNVFGGHHDQELVGVIADEVESNLNHEKDKWMWSPGRIINTIYSWSGFYSLIYQCNLMIDNIWRFENVAQDRLDFYVAEAKFFRAYAYFELVRRWGDVPVVPNSTVVDKFPRTDKVTVLEEQVIKVAREALEVLPLHEALKDEKGTNVTSKQWASKGTAATLIAQAYAEKASLTGDVADWEQAEIYCSKIINGEVGAYSLAADPREVCEKVMIRGSSESIFETEYDLADHTSSGVFISDHSFWATGYMIGWPIDTTVLHTSVETQLIRIKKETVLSMFDKDDRRLNAYFTFREDSQYAYLIKWNKPIFYYFSSKEKYLYCGQDNNTVRWRLADIMLLRAECRARLGSSNAVEDLNMIRERAYGNRLHDYKASEGDIRLIIFREREKELMYEDYRYFDVMRNGYWKTELQGSFATMSEEEFNKGARYYPVSSAAFGTNDLMVQTEYWLTKQ